MERWLLEEAVRLLEKANAGLSPALSARAEAEPLLGLYARVEKLAGFGKATLAARVGDAGRLARVTGTTVGRARQTIETGRRMAEEPRLSEAVRRAEVSLDQAGEIARTTAVAPEAMEDLLGLARTGSFHALEDRARSIRLSTENRTDLPERQHQARRLRHRVGELGMIHIEADLEPHVGVPIVNRLEDEARRLARRAWRTGDRGEPFERHLADALPAVLSGTATGSGRPELVILVSHEVTQRGWHQVQPGEKCDIPGVGPISPQAARRIADDAFLSGVFYDGTDLRHLKRWTRNIPQPVRLALELGNPPHFDGRRCIDCGNRFRLEIDHIEPHAAGGPASVANTRNRCHPCHQHKTATDHQTAKPQPPQPP